MRGGRIRKCDIVIGQRGKERITRLVLRAGMPPGRKRAVIRPLGIDKIALLRAVDVEVRCKARSARRENDFGARNRRPENVVSDWAARAAIIGEAAVRET